eukprot:365067-Chlamydomonas_euryale.AAC.26
MAISAQPGCPESGVAWPLGVSVRPKLLSLRTAAASRGLPEVLPQWPRMYASLCRVVNVETVGLSQCYAANAADSNVPGCLPDAADIYCTRGWGLIRHAVVSSTAHTAAVVFRWQK